MIASALGVVLIGVGSTGCHPSSAPVRTPAPTEPSLPVSAVLSNTLPGDVLDATVPLLGGQTVTLASLRGRPVVLELAMTGLPGWAAAQQHWRTVLARHGPDAVTVVSVAMDPRPETLHPHWDRDPPAFMLGWDPQGALALRLGVGRLPAILVLASDGKVVGSAHAYDAATLAEVDRWIQSALDLERGPDQRPAGP
jgi:hypothetical protein